MKVDGMTAEHVSEISGNKIFLCSNACNQQVDQYPSNMDNEANHKGIN
jgi:YHS domain-containing protein